MDQLKNVNYILKLLFYLILAMGGKLILRMVQLPIIKINNKFNPFLWINRSLHSYMFYFFNYQIFIINKKYIFIEIVTLLKNSTTYFIILIKNKTKTKSPNMKINFFVWQGWARSLMLFSVVWLLKNPCVLPQPQSPLWLATILATLILILKNNLFDKLKKNTKK